MKYLISTKPIHVEKLCNFLNNYTDLEYFITTEKPEIYMVDNYDIGISYCSPYIIKDTNLHPWFNYHPGPLPEYPGTMNYANAIKDRVTEYGVTVHRMTSFVDSGQIIFKKIFKLDSVPINSNELGCITHYHLFQLFKETVNMLEENI